MIVAIVYIYLTQYIGIGVETKGRGQCHENQSFDHFYCINSSDFSQKRHFSVSKLIFSFCHNHRFKRCCMTCFTCIGIQIIHVPKHMICKGIRCPDIKKGWVILFRRKSTPKRSIFFTADRHCRDWVRFSVHTGC
jgi:hypothetical protein